MRIATILITAAALVSCGNPCSPSGLHDTAEQAIESNFSPGLDPSYKWEADSAIGDNVSLVRGHVTINTLGGARQDRRAIVRVWCDGSNDPEATMVYVANMMDKEFNEAGHDVGLTKSNEEYQRSIDSLTKSLDSLLR